MGACKIGYLKKSEIRITLMSNYGGKLNWTLSAEVGLVANVGTVTVEKRWCTSM